MLPDTHMWKSQAAKELGLTGQGVRGLIAAGRLSEDEVTDSDGQVVKAISRDAVAACKPSDEDLASEWVRPKWRETHVTIGVAANQLGVSKELMHGLVSRKGIPLEDVQNSRGRTIKVINKATLTQLQAKMAEFK